MQYIFFDLDGTLTDSALGITRSVQYALKKYGIDENNQSMLNNFVGPPLKDSFMKYYGFSEDKAQEAIWVYREYYEVKGINENFVYDGIEATLKALKDAGKKLYVATSKPEQYAKQILKNFNLLDYFTFVGGATMDEKLVEKCDIIKYVATANNLLKEKSDIIMVGDREHDIIGAKKFGVKAIGVLYGYGDLEELNGAGTDFIAKTPDELIKIILK